MAGQQNDNFKQSCTTPKSYEIKQTNVESEICL